MTAPAVRRRVFPQATIPATDALADDGNVPFLTGMEWSPAYVAFLCYIFAIVTYRLPIGTASMVIALVTLPLEKRPLRFPPLLGWLVALLVWAAVGWTTTEYPDLVYDNVVEFSKVCGVMLVALNVLTTRARLRMFLVVLLTFFALYPARGTVLVYFFYGGAGGRAAWNYTYANPNDLAGICLLMTSLSAGVLVTTRLRWVKLGALAGTLLLPFVILLTQSRGAFIALLACAAFALRAYWRSWKTLVLAAVVIAVGLYAAPATVWERLGTLKQVAAQDVDVRVDDEGSADQRLEIWKVARTIVAENPVTGVGLGAYGRTHYLYAQRSVFRPTARGARDTHSTYLGVAAQTGIPGFLIFLAIIVTTVIDAERTRRRVKLTRPSAALQLQYMELGLFGFLVAGIWGSYGFLVLTYLHLSLIAVTSHLLRSEGAPVAVPPRGLPARGRGGNPAVVMRGARR